jgi:hypothetical protein
VPAASSPSWPTMPANDFSRYQPPTEPTCPTPGSTETTKHQIYQGRGKSSMERLQSSNLGLGSATQPGIPTSGHRLLAARMAEGEGEGMHHGRRTCLIDAVHTAWGCRPVFRSPPHEAEWRDPAATFIGSAQACPVVPSGDGQ